MEYSESVHEGQTAIAKNVSDHDKNPALSLREELHLLDLKLLLFLTAKQESEEFDGETTDYFVSESEVRFLLETADKPKNHDIKSKTIEELTDTIHQLEEKVSGADPPVEEESALSIKMIRDKFHLDRFEVQVLVMALALETDRKYERIFAFFNDDLNKKAPSIELSLGVFDKHQGSQASGYRYFSEQSPLRLFDLIRFVNVNEEESFLSRRFKLDEGIRNLMLGIDSVHPGIRSLLRLNQTFSFCKSSPRNESLGKEIRKVLENNYDNEAKGLVFWLYGKSGTEKKSIVSKLGREFAVPLLAVHVDDILASADASRTIKLLFREAIITSGIIYLQGGDFFSEDDSKSRLLKKQFLELTADFSWFSFVEANNFWAPEEHNTQLRWCPIEVKELSFNEKKDVWAELLNGLKVESGDIDAVASRFNFDGNQIAKAVGYLNLRPNGSEVHIDSLLKACSFQSPRNLPSFTKKIAPHYRWNDLVLPPDKMRHLKEICGFMKHKHQVFYKWGFEKKLSLGKGLNILFTGPSGTGKTMTAEILADELKLDLYKTDLSSIVSKYIGETEKNLEKVFEAASSGNAILFFDEADALFGKRSEVKDAHDRFANIETNYLLQRIEEHNGVVILSTNLGKNMDDAFLRRMQFNVEFPFPNEQNRELIWKKMYPVDTPLGEEIDYRFLSKKLNISGGNIKNIALASAFLAAEESSIVDMRHILLAVKREYQKLGKAFVKSDFTKFENVFEEWSN